MSTTLTEVKIDAGRMLSPARLDRRQPIGTLLVQAGVLTQEDVDLAIGRQRKSGVRLGETLLEMGLIDEPTLVRFLGLQQGVPSVQLREAVVDPSVIRLISRRDATRFSALAMFRVRDELTVAMADPLDLAACDALRRATGLRINPVLALHSAIEKLIDRGYEDDFTVDAVTSEVSPDAIELRSDTIDISLEQIESTHETSPIINLVNYIIVNAIRHRGSDIHIEPGPNHTTVRLRVDGRLQEVLRPRRDLHPALISRLKVMAKLDIAEHRLPQDGRMHVAVEGREIDVRLSTLPTILGEKVVMRLLDRKAVTFDLGALGVPSGGLSTLRKMLARPHGLVLVTGPTGSGKTTTLYSSLELIKSVHSNIVTVEDPVEYQLDGVNQVHVGEGRQITFATALRSILRQDPDVIMVGEIRDQETANAAIQAALTGHLVLSTLHTNDALSAVTRLRDMGVEAFKIAAALNGVIAQRLVRRVCGKCKTSYFPEVDLLTAAGYPIDTRRQFARGTGCKNCFDTGSRGRTGIYEIVDFDAQLRELIAADADLQSVQNAYRQKGGLFLRDHGRQLAEEGVISLQELCETLYSD